MIEIQKKNFEFLLYRQHVCDRNVNNVTNAHLDEATVNSRLNSIYLGEHISMYRIRYEEQYTINRGSRACMCERVCVTSTFFLGL